MPFMLVSKNECNEKLRSTFCRNQSKKSNQSTMSCFVLNLRKLLNYFVELHKVCMKRRINLEIKDLKLIPIDY